MSAFLLEIGVEEIPAGMIAAAQADLAERVEKLLRRERIAADDLRITSYSTPRRLAVIAEGILPKQADIEEEVVGPSTKVAYKDGALTPAAIAFAKKSVVEVSALKTIQNAKGEYVAATVRRRGRAAVDVLTAELPREASAIAWPKSMVWRDGKPESFVRPVRWLVALLDKEILPFEFAGVVADRLTYGHRVLHGDAPVVIHVPRDYVEKLATAFVAVEPGARKQRIRKALDAAARIIPGARWREDEALVETVTNLTEWTSVVAGNFDASYLSLPQEILVTVMRDHQKYFALEDANGKLLPNFLAVLNIEVDATGAAIIRHGNERVLRARFNDARFFWDQDQKIPLVDRVEMLKHVTFHKDLGSYWDKMKRTQSVARQLNARIGLDSSDTSNRAVFVATQFAKADLTAEMVKEFPELQGIVGGLYIEKQGSKGLISEETNHRDVQFLSDPKNVKDIAEAVYEHYKPNSATDRIPKSITGCVVSIADKLDSITEMFRIGQKPTGSRDPFALRRAGTGVVRILTENERIGERLHLASLVFAAMGHDDNASNRSVYDFLLDRFEFYLQDSVKILLQVARAVRNSGIASMDAAMFKDSVRTGEKIGADYGFAKVAGFAKALNEQVGSPNLLAVGELMKRTSNILRQAKENKISILSIESSELLKEPAEVELACQVAEADTKIRTSYYAGKYAEVIAAIAALQPALNAFFDSVMVMVDDEKLRANRLALLARTEATVRWAADFSELASIQ